VSTTYPDSARERAQWILSRRSSRNTVDPRRPYAAVVEHERAESGEIVPVTTLFLTNRECPWRCLMCDLWKNTLTESLPPGAIPGQIDWALNQLGVTAAPTAPRPRHIKLYNSGSFFDPRAVPPGDHPAIAERLREFERVIVECHPALVDDPVLRFRDLLTGKLEVAMGLETAHPEVLARLNKRMSLEQFSRAAAFLREHDIALRVFVLVKPPFLDDGEALHWAKRSLDVAFDCSATVACLIPTRAGNGAMEALAAEGNFTPPDLALVEEATRHGIALRRGRVFADLWDLETFSRCPACFPERKARLERMNLGQFVEPLVPCSHCDDVSRAAPPPDRR
jgi:radical SAM enzyme (TIGR01210 family)